MRIFNVLTALAAATAVSAAAPKTSDYSAADIASGVAFNNVSRIALNNQQYHKKTTSCTFKNARKRQEWRTLSKSTRKSFTDAVKCLMNKPPTHMTAAQSASYPGVKSRHDEYATSENLHLKTSTHIILDTSQPTSTTLTTCTTLPISSHGTEHSFTSGRRICS